MNGQRIWPESSENEFQTFMAFDPAVRAWRNAFTRRYGEAPQINGGDFDYRAAWMAGNRPQPTPGDPLIYGLAKILDPGSVVREGEVPHWSSVGKTANHPTMWKQTFMDRFGADPDTVTAPTPEMRDFMREQMQRQMLADMLIGGRR